MTVCGTCRLGGWWGCLVGSSWGFGPVFSPCGSFVSLSGCRPVGGVWFVRSRALLPRFRFSLVCFFCLRLLLLAEVLVWKYCLRLQFYLLVCVSASVNFPLLFRLCCLRCHVSSFSFVARCNFVSGFVTFFMFYLLFGFGFS